MKLTLVEKELHTRRAVIMNIPKGFPLLSILTNNENNKSLSDRILNFTIFIM